MSTPEIRLVRDITAKKQQMYCRKIGGPDMHSLLTTEDGRNS